MMQSGKKIGPIPGSNRRPVTIENLIPGEKPEATIIPLDQPGIVVKVRKALLVADILRK
jgi:hypothetical protein